MASNFRLERNAMAKLIVYKILGPEAGFVIEWIQQTLQFQHNSHREFNRYMRTEPTLIDYAVAR